MKPNRIFRMSKCLALAALATFMYGCLDKENLYTPDPTPEPLPPASDYFDFNLRGEVKLSVNYNLPNAVADVKVYTEYPIEYKNYSYVIKDGLKSIAGAFTKDGKLETTIYIPTAVKEAYLYTEHWGLPMCVKLEATADGFVYDATKPQDTRSSRAAAGGGVLNDVLPYRLAPESRIDNFYSLCYWDGNGKVTTPNYLGTPSLLTGGVDAISGIAARVQDFMNKNKEDKGDNTNLVAKPDALNLFIEADTKVEVTFVADNAAFKNTFGYYYYYKGGAPTNAVEFIALKTKFVVFPDASVADPGMQPPLASGNTVKLKYFGADGTGPESETFPSGYTIGWFALSDAGPTGGWYSGGFPFPDYIQPMSQPDMAVLSNKMFFTDGEGQYAHFAVVYDRQTKTRVIGLEDEVGFGDKDYDDVVFFATTNPGIAPSPDLPAVGEDPEPPVGTQPLSGTLCFEDTWPDGGDYDMNDVAVEYDRVMTYKANNEVSDVVETFKFMQRSGAATNDNFFAYQVDSEGDLELPEGCVYEEASKSIIITKSAKNIIGQTFVIKRTFSDGRNQTTVEKDFNPYIIMGKGGTYPEKDRIEVHLPKYKVTNLADKTSIGTGKDAYFIDRAGGYPFAIDIPVANFNLAGEKTAIDVAYPKFRSWVDSNGTTDADWYQSK